MGPRVGGVGKGAVKLFIGSQADITIDIITLQLSNFNGISCLLRLILQSLVMIYTSHLSLFLNTLFLYVNLLH